ncbi:bifunctional demethylmenaquinone methyltransferase/2-methoxy-6-polyprenyl-1,4-benzoquinol methylase UbiE [Duncaniella muricolitica]|uniref:bifunctional demethylmenaquinone methyltransferase/2-methoxy-6-polyprenyl-1,4-benzoquinol methylase UbiE n=1 Tax=Duncaniella muricolitica TaxID=2880704 RepID=UPI00244E1346|nr:bifunctional demethylmenaquinone methyltransferase/2-methoxy-6-polyprenyl-1,4-benzoquinol methylase UbiE [Duncaniella muricolitica]
MDVERITPYGDGSGDKTRQVREMFDSIAPAYDFMNRAMTMGIDRLWRYKAVRLLRDCQHDDILDIATGTGDLAIKLARELDPIAVTGVDLSEGMIEIGRAKVAKEGLQEVVTLGIGDCLLLPFTDASFDVVTCAYGVRNFADLLAGYREMHRVLRPGGRAVILELSTPTSPMVRPLYNFYTRHVIPTVGRLVSKDVRAYSYLPESIAAVPQGDAMTAIMLEAGFSQARAIPLTMGVCTIYEAVS